MGWRKPPHRCLNARTARRAPPLAPHPANPISHAASLGAASTSVVPQDWRNRVQGLDHGHPILRKSTSDNAAGEPFMDSITIQATDGGTFTAFYAAPDRPTAGSVVLIQEIFGVNDSMKETAREVAAQGFHVLVPDLFWRLQPGVDLTDKSDAEWQEAMRLMKAFNQNAGVRDLKATLAIARTLPGANGRAGTMGYCLGGRLAVMMAVDSDADVNVSYYGVGLDDLIPKFLDVKTPLLMHIADKDNFFPAEGRAKVVDAAKANPHLHAYVYPDADHAFARVGGTHFQARAATIANGRSAEALANALG